MRTKPVSKQSKAENDRGVPERRPRGRPRAFERCKAVEQAMRLFWDRGYEGASFQALTEAMGLSASSLQNAFGSKEALFREAVQLYVEEPTAWFVESLQAPTTTREAFAALCVKAADGFAGAEFPLGCMVSLAATQVSPDLRTVRAFATQMRQASQGALAERIRRGIAEGDMPADTDADALAAFFGAVFRGMAVQARDGASREALRAVGEAAMRAWPQSKR